MNEIVIVDLSREEAEQLTAAIVTGMSSIHGLIVQAYQGRAWLALGYQTWDAYCDGRLAGMRPAIERDERREMVGELRAAGLSTRAIGSALGADARTVRRDLTGANAPVPERITGLDGIERPSTRAEPEEPAWTAEELRMASAVRRGEIVVATLREGQHDRLIAWASAASLAVRIDRRTEWGNPFEMPADGDRNTVITNYRDHYLPFKPSLLVKLGDLRGRVLICWCAPLPCHGDVLRAWAQR